ncbi:MAG: zf-HC2 domain-containing protein [Gemmatimonadaceae bacterium]
MTQHFDDQVLSDLVDGTLDATARRAAEEHIAACDACFARVQRLRSLLARAAALPGIMSPPAEEWSRVRARIESVTVPAAVPAPWWTRRSVLLAAGLALVMVSSAVTALVVNGTRDPVVRETAATTAPSTLIPRLAALEHDYATVTRDLERELAERKHTLTPETIAAVERSLRTIDAAIAEARDALARDPSSETVARLFVAGHDQKVELLRYAMRLATQS